jgi:hypothetical protein
MRVAKLSAYNVNGALNVNCLFIILSGNGVSTIPTGQVIGQNYDFEVNIRDASEI